MKINATVIILSLDLNNLTKFKTKEAPIQNFNFGLNLMNKIFSYHNMDENQKSILSVNRYVKLIYFIERP